jgi:hypothetical protein
VGPVLHVTGPDDISREVVPRSGRLGRAVSLGSCRFASIPCISYLLACASLHSGCRLCLYTAWVGQKTAWSLCQLARSRIGRQVDRLAIIFVFASTDAVLAPFGSSLELLGLARRRTQPYKIGWSYSSGLSARGCPGGTKVGHGQPYWTPSLLLCMRVSKTPKETELDTTACCSPISQRSTRGRRT